MYSALMSMHNLNITGPLWNTYIYNIRSPQNTASMVNSPVESLDLK